MSSQFLAKPPLPVTWKAIPRHLWWVTRRTGYIFWQILVPFRSRPEEITPLPEPKIELTESHLKQCQWIFDQAEQRRTHLEQKAQSTFGLMIFLVPLLASLFVFLIGKGIASSKFLILLVVLSAVLLLLGFTSAVRAVAVKETETLFLGSVIDEDGQFREYSKSSHARGLLYCASMNTATNDHIAQFVKGAHILTAGAILVLLAAAIPTSLAFIKSRRSAQAEIVGTVNVSSRELTAIRDDISALRSEIEKSPNAKITEERFQLLEHKLEALDSRLSHLQKGAQVAPNKKK